MYNAQTTKKRIMDLCKNQSAEQMLKDCSLGVNAIRQINDTKGMASFSLAKIADYLDCSVDYLLGRTDNPQAHIKATAVNNKLIALLAQLTEEQQVMLEAQIKGLLEQKKSPPPNGDGK